MSDTLKLFTLQNHHLFVFYFAAATALHCTILSLLPNCCTVHCTDWTGFESMTTLQFILWQIGMTIKETRLGVDIWSILHVGLPPVLPLAVHLKFVWLNK